MTVLLNVGPLQEIIKEKLGTKQEFLSSIGLTVTEYLKQAPPDDTRLFIWTLEEHRDDYLSCHAILDEYFDMMGTCLTWPVQYFFFFFGCIFPLCHFNISFLFFRWALFSLKKV